jgi:hypothetical protein
VSRPFDYDLVKVVDGDFRVLTILPSSSSAEKIRCTLSTEKASNAPKYSALSYTWDGYGAEKFPIFIADNDRESGSSEYTIDITSRLYAFLLELREEHGRLKPIRVWIDQICINQKSDLDKTCQVKQMGAIYKNAAKTFLWLGPSTSQEEGHLIKFFNDFKTTGINNLVPATSFGLGFIPRVASEEYGAFQRMLNRKWFTRTWIFQEAVLSVEVEVWIGSTFKQPFKTLLDVVAAVADAEVNATGYANSIVMQTVGYDTLFLIKHSRRGECGKGSACKPLDDRLQGNFLGLLMNAMHQFQASDPRDYIYGFLEFIPKDSGKLQVSIKVNCGDEVVKVWRDAATALIKQAGSLEVFAAARGEWSTPGQVCPWETKWSLPGSDGLPSWVPYWPEAFPYARPICAPDFDSKFCAWRALPCGDAGKYHEWIEPTDPTKELIVRGVQASRIVWVSPHNFGISFYRAAGGTKAVLQLEEHIHSARRFAGLAGGEFQAKFNRRYQGEHNLRVAVMRTLLADGAFGHQNGLAKSDVEMRLHIMEHEDGIQGDARHELHGLLETFRTEGLIVQKKRVFMTAGGHLGLAAQDINDEDIVCVLRGSPTPCILRAVGKEDRLRRVGQCYMEGTMYGEEKMEGELQRFVLE